MRTMKLADGILAIVLSIFLITVGFLMSAGSATSTVNACNSSAGQAKQKIDTSYSAKCNDAAGFVQGGYLIAFVGVMLLIAAMVQLVYSQTRPQPEAQMPQPILVQYGPGPVYQVDPTYGPPPPPQQYPPY